LSDTSIQPWAGPQQEPVYLRLTGTITCAKLGLVHLDRLGRRPPDGLYHPARPV